MPQRSQLTTSARDHYTKNKNPVAAPHARQRTACDIRPHNSVGDRNQRDKTADAPLTHKSLSSCGTRNRRCCFTIPAASTTGVR